MARPIREGTRIRTFKRKQGNGDYYVFEREVEYDPETRRDKTLSLRLIGKIPKGSEVMVSTRHRTPPEKKSADGTTRYRLGMLSLLKWVGKESGIDEDLKSALPQLKYG
ncbi:MAG: hypothetical protein IJ228_05130, partial [Succinivibrio sp.]|nr:hypothetical protein [Succinivibrio sp.]